MRGGVQRNDPPDDVEVEQQLEANPREEGAEHNGIVTPLFPGAASPVQRVSRTRPLLIASSVALLFAIAARLPYFLNSDFPLNDGGMFLTMSRDLLAAHFALPADTSYNFEGIPFAYPPLSFYLVAGLSALTGLDPLILVQYLPLVASLATVVAMAALARSLLGTGWAALLAPVIFAVAPRGYEWMVMGGGLTRSVGFFFAIASLSVAAVLYRRPTARLTLACGALAAAALASHLELGLLAFYSLATMAILRGRSLRAVLSFFAVALTAAVLTAPWWVTVIARDGLAPFDAASLTSYFSTVGQSFDFFVSSTFPAGFLMGLFGIAAAIGAVACFIRGEFFLPVWLPAVYIWIPRSAQSEATAPLALLAAVGFADVLGPGLLSVMDRAGSSKLAAEALALVRQTTNPSRAALALNYLGLLLIAAAVYVYSPKMHADPVALDPLPAGDRQTMAWIAQNTPPSAQFLVLSTGWAWETDSAAEWFPVLAQRKSLLTPQGTEWLPSQTFARTQCLFNSTRALAGMRVDVNYLDSWARDRGLAFSYIYISKANRGNVDWNPIVSSARSSPSYTVLVDNSAATVLERREPVAPYWGPPGQLLVSRDCQSLADQPRETQSAYFAAYGQQAMWVWVEQRDEAVQPPPTICGRLEGFGLGRLGMVRNICRSDLASGPAVPGASTPAIIGPGP